MPMNMRCNILKPYNKEIEKTGGIDPIVIESVNHISGAHAALFWDILYGTSESIIALEMWMVRCFCRSSDRSIF